MTNTTSGRTNAIFELLETEEKRIRQVLLDNANDLEDLQSEWQERDSPAERNIHDVEWSQFAGLQRDLAAVIDSKRRLEDGTYGKCEDCGKEISPKRLQAIPIAAKCITCQELAEKL